MIATSSALHAEAVKAIPSTIQIFIRLTGGDVGKSIEHVILAQVLQNATNTLVAKSSAPLQFVLTILWVLCDPDQVFVTLVRVTFVAIITMGHRANVDFLDGIGSCWFMLNLGIFYLKSLFCVWLNKLLQHHPRIAETRSDTQNVALALVMKDVT